MLWQLFLHAWKTQNRWVAIGQGTVLVGRSWGFGMGVKYVLLSAWVDVWTFYSKMSEGESSEGQEVGIKLTVKIQCVLLTHRPLCYTENRSVICLSSSWVVFLFRPLWYMCACFNQPRSSLAYGWFCFFSLSPCLFERMEAHAWTWVVVLYTRRQSTYWSSYFYVLFLLSMCTGGTLILQPVSLY
jgi:hypothetical protein